MAAPAAALRPLRLALWLRPADAVAAQMRAAGAGPAGAPCAAAAGPSGRRHGLFRTCRRHGLVAATTPANYWRRPVSEEVGAAAPAGTVAGGRELTGPDAAAWEASLALVQTAAGLEMDGAQYILERAFCWGARGAIYWRGDKSEELPDPARLAAVLALLTDPDGLAFGVAELRPLLAQFPEVLACDLDGRIRANMKKMEDEWGITGPALARAVRRKPQVLGNTFTCSGDCIGECNRCWARC